MLILKKFYISSFHNSSVFHQITAITYGSVWWWFSVVSNSLLTHGLEPTRLLCPWNSLGKNTGVGSHSLLQGIFPTQWSNLVSRIAGRFFTIWAIKEANIIIQIIEGGMISQSQPVPFKGPTILSTCDLRASITWYVIAIAFCVPHLIISLRRYTYK